MLMHLFKTIWNRKKSNSLIIAEVAIAFIVVSSIATLGIRNYNLYVQPLGFEYQNMWNISFYGIGEKWQADRDQPQLQQLINLLKQQPEIEKVQLLKNPTFRNWRGSSSYKIDGKSIQFLRNSMDDDAPITFGMKLVNGRWFGLQDQGQNYNPVIVNRHFAEEFFPGEDVIGKSITQNEKEEDASLKEQRIVGVFENFRQQGEFNKLTPYVIYRYDVSEPKDSEIHNIELKMTPGTTKSYEESLHKMLKSAAPNWDFKVAPWKLIRQMALKETMVPSIGIAVIGAFLIIMVAMGLFGVLWQNISSRTQEIGLRRALGATAKGIHIQVISELMIVTLLGITIALILLIQLPILGVFQELTWTLFWSGQLVSILFMLLLSVLCAYYPGKLATALSPAEALHYE